MSKLDWENGFSEQFHPSWHSKIKGFFETEEAWSIYQFLKERSKTNHVIYPSSDLVFRAFKECNYDDLKVILVAMEPYASSINRIPVADGLALSCKNTKKIQPSLSTFLNAVKQDCYKDMNINLESIYDLTFLANSGVLLTNVSLTVEANKISSHTSQGLWLPFWKYLIEQVFNKYNSGLHYLLLGKESQKIEKWILPFNNYIWKENHPSYYARTNSDWNTNVFSNINKIIKENNGDSFQVNWLNIKQEEEICPF